MKMTFGNRRGAPALLVRVLALAVSAVPVLLLVFGAAFLASSLALVNVFRQGEGVRERRPSAWRVRLHRPISVPRASLPALLATMAVAGVSAPLAVAHFNGTSDASISSATGPIAGGTTYAGRFGGSGDSDYYYFNTTRDNVSLHFTVRNLESSCDKKSSCQIYATLLDPAGNQLGGEGSAAGTGPVGYAGSGYSTDTIDWTFPTAGRYILVFDSDGGTPPYQFRIDTSDGVAPGIATNVGPIFRLFTVASPQSTTRVRAGLTVVPGGATLRADLLRTVNGHSVIAGTFTRSAVPAGRLIFRVPLNASARAAVQARGSVRMSVRARVTVRGRPSQTASRRVTVLR